MERHAGTGFSSHQIGKNDDPANHEEHEYLFETKCFPEGQPPAFVECKMGLTINIGNYESARIDVGIRLPCMAAEAEQTWQNEKGWCEQKIKEEVRKIRGRS